MTDVAVSQAKTKNSKMTDVAVSQAKTKNPKKTAVTKKPAIHPKYCDMVKEAISALQEKGGSSRHAILAYICKNYNVSGEKIANSHLKLALRAGVVNKDLKQPKGSGAAGSFKLADEKVPKKMKPKMEKVKKPKAAKPKMVKKIKPTKEKKATPVTPKKPIIKKSAKKISKPKMIKAVKPTKTKKVTSPVKKVVKK